MSADETVEQGLREALRRVEGMALLPALEVLLKDADDGAKAQRAAAAAHGKPEPYTLLQLSAAFGMAAGLRIATTLAHDRAFREE